MYLQFYLFPQHRNHTASLSPISLPGSLSHLSITLFIIVSLVLLDLGVRVWLLGGLLAGLWVDQKGSTERVAPTPGCRWHLLTGPQTEQESGNSALCQHSRLLLCDSMSYSAKLSTKQWMESPEHKNPNKTSSSYLCQVYCYLSGKRHRCVGNRGAVPMCTMSCEFSSPMAEPAPSRNGANGRICFPGSSAAWWSGALRELLVLAGALTVLRILFLVHQAESVLFTPLFQHFASY